MTSQARGLKSRQHTEYTIDCSQGLIRPAQQCPSPNQDERPANADLRLIVLHSISLPPGEFSGRGIEQFFTNSLDCDRHPYFAKLRGLEVSAHLLIRRDGSVTQFVPFNRRAWHAGQSSFQGEPCCNDYSIGIELEGVDDLPYDDRQYRVLTSVVGALVRSFPTLGMRRIAAHSDIAPARKTDPGPAFDWFRLYDGVTHLNSERS